MGKTRIYSRIFFDQRSEVDFKAKILVLHGSRATIIPESKASVCARYLKSFISDEVQCLVCYNKKYKSGVNSGVGCTTCGKVICYSCIDKMIDNKLKMLCPQCRGELFYSCKENEHD